MLDKCSNPSCGESFRYLQQGRLFRLDNDLSVDLSRQSRPEYFWLCANCAAKMTLRLDESTGIRTLSVPDQMHTTESTTNFVTLDRKYGLVLSGLHFLGRKPPSSWTPSVRGKLIYAS